MTQGSSPAAQDIEAFAPAVGGGDLNTETSSLRLTTASTANWVTATVGSRRACSKREGDCLPIRFTFATQQLQTGRYSATVTVSDPNAVDAPQNVLVIVQVGGGVPASIDFYLPPGGSAQREFVTNSRVSGAATTQSGGDWLTLVLGGAGSFDFVQPYTINAKPPATLAEGTYRGTVSLRNSAFAGDNKDVAVTLRVTNSPIAASNTDRLRVRLAQNSTTVDRTVLIYNGGKGALTVSEATATTEAGGNWMKTVQIAGTNYFTTTFSTEGVSPGIYKGNLAFATNGVNGTVNVPVEFEVVPQGPAGIRLNGVQDIAAFQEGDVLAAGMIVAAFGEQLSYEKPAVNTSTTQLPTTLGGVQVFVNDKAAPLFYTSYDQVNFLVPVDTPEGEGAIRIDRGGQRGNTISARFKRAVPKLLRLQLRNIGIVIPEPRDYYAIAVNASDGTLSLPREFNIPGSRPSKPGEVVVLFGIGFGPTTPTVASGAVAPSNPPAVVNSDRKTVFFGALALNSGAPQEAAFVGLAPGFAGLYQINVVVPANSPKGDVPVRVQMDTAASEYGFIAVE
ncbi:MAG: hypothetical protein IT168_25845 [Bryobacterales bacterium]|nr:hypothetical protein [Bryobacterales bacterium]